MFRIVVITFLSFGAVIPFTSTRGDSRLQINTPAQLAPLMQDFTKLLRRESPGLNYTTAETDLSENIQALISGDCDMILSTRPLTEEEFKTAVNNGVYPFHHLIAWQSLAVIVYPENDARNIRIDHLRKMYQDRVRSWKYNGWKDVPVLPVSQNADSAAHELFTRLVMQEEDWLQKYKRYPEQDEEAVAGKVQVNWGAVGYVGPQSLGRYVRPLAVEGIEYTPENIRSGKYPLVSPVFFITRGWPTDSARREFIALRFAESGRQVLESRGFTPLTENQSDD